MLAIGSVVDGRYDVEDLLGEGGMGVVFRARHRFTGAVVALKMLHPHLRLRPDLAARFLVEARAPAAIGHPGIVSVLDGGVTPEGDPYFAMELLSGEPLQQLMRRLVLSFEATRHICLEILDALAAAHAAGFIHRDLKPENVFVQSPSGSIKLLDFGITKSLSDAEQESSTRTGATMGTLLYMSPEQLRNAKRVDHRTDLWAVGVMFQQMLTGELPYRAESVGDMLMLVLSQPPRPLALGLTEVPSELEVVMARALAADPNARFSSAQEMAHAIAGLPSYVLQRSAMLAGGPSPHAVAPPTLTAAPAHTHLPVASPALSAVPTAPRAKPLWPLMIAGIGLLGVLAVAVLMLSGIGGWVFFSKRQVDSLAPGCGRACAAMLSCGLPGDKAECMTGCQSSPKQGECMAAAGSDCNAIGACYVETICGRKPRGTASCRDTLACESACGVNDLPCACACRGAAAPGAGARLAIVNACVLRYCEDDCVDDKASRARCDDCASKRCADEIAKCKGDDSPGRPPQPTVGGPDPLSGPPKKNRPVPKPPPPAPEPPGPGPGPAQP